jgi:hypothetical protein
MKSFLLLALLIAIVVPQQPDQVEAPDFVVLKFKCGPQAQGSGMIRSVQDPDTHGNEPITINQTVRNEPQELKNRRDMQERRVEMRTAEVNAAISGQPTSKYYFYRIQVQNTGAKPVKSFVWEYRPPNESDPYNRQFFCVVNAKPAEKKEFELSSPLAPSRIVDASKIGDKTDADKKANIVINKIEYMDGTFWKRPTWNIATFLPEDTSKVGGGKCIGI